MLLDGLDANSPNEDPGREGGLSTDEWAKRISGARAELDGLSVPLSDQQYLARELRNLKVALERLEETALTIIYDWVSDSGTMDLAEAAQFLRDNIRPSVLDKPFPESVTHRALKGK